MKPNYLAWELHVDDFYKLNNQKDKLKFLIKFAVLAPSTHNSQPWQFDVGEDFIAVRANFERKLVVSDPENRHLYISLGAAMENILIAGKFYGYNTTIEYFPDKNDVLVAKIKFQISSTLDSLYSNLIYAIQRRHSNRGEYLEKIPSQQFLSSLDGLLLPEIALHKTTDQKTKNNIADALMQARIELFSDIPFRLEMLDYKKTNFTKSPFGMPGFVMGFSNLFSLIAPLLIRYSNPMKVLKDKETELLQKHTPVFLFISSSLHDNLSWVKTGQVLQRILLTSELSGIQTAVSAVPVKIETLQNILNIKNRPQLFIRLGYAKTVTPHSPRLKAEEVTN